MTKETMIWQTLEMILAGMVMNKEIPAKEDFEKTVIEKAKCILAYSEEDIKQVLHTRDCLGFAEVSAHLFGNSTAKNNVA